MTENGQKHLGKDIKYVFAFGQISTTINKGGQWEKGPSSKTVNFLKIHTHRFLLQKHEISQKMQAETNVNMIFQSSFLTSEDAFPNHIELGISATLLTSRMKNKIHNLKHKLSALFYNLLLISDFIQGSELLEQVLCSNGNLDLGSSDPLNGSM